MSNTILIQTTPVPRIQEAVGGASITPGQALIFNSSEALIPHNVEGGNLLPLMVAVEQEWVGNDITTAYASGDDVRYIIPQRGDVIYMWLEDGQTVDKGDPLEVSTTAGVLQEHTPQAVDEGGAATFTSYLNAIVGVAEEDTAASGADARIKVRII